MTSPVVSLSPHDLYALSRAFVGMSWDGVPLSPAAALLLAHLDPNQPEDLRFLRKVLGQELIQAILAVDPNAPPPEVAARPADLNIVPELPEAARLTEAQIREAHHVGSWLTEYVAWAGKAANETPLLFHQGAGLYPAAHILVRVAVDGCGVVPHLYFKRHLLALLVHVTQHGVRACRRGQFSKHE